jgi:hypothetical protein
MDTTPQVGYLLDGSILSLPEGVTPSRNEAGQQRRNNEGLYGWLDRDGMEGWAPERATPYPPPTETTTSSNNSTSPPAAQAPSLVAMDAATILNMFAGLQAQIARLSTAPAGLDYAPRGGQAKLKEPEKVNGTKKEAIQPLLDHCDMVFEAQARTYLNDRLKIIYACNLLEKDAATWSRQYALGLTPITWSDFKAKFLQAWGAGARLAHTEKEWVECKQGSRSLGAYVTEFNALAGLLPRLDDYAKRLVFRAHLNQAWQNAITPMMIPEDMTLLEFQEECFKYEGHVQSTKNNYSGNTHKTYIPYVKNTAPAGPPVTNVNVTTPSGGNTGGPMELDVARMPKQRTCFRCFQPGHIATDCNNPKRDPPAWFKNRRAGQIQISAAQLQPVDEGWSTEWAKQNGEDMFFGEH